MDKTKNKDQVKNDQDNDYLLLDDNTDKSNQNLKTDLSIEDMAAELKETRDDLEHYRKLYDDTFNKLKYSLADFDNYQKKFFHLEISIKVREKYVMILQNVSRILATRFSSKKF